jgi:hypothetical protein
MRKNSNLTRKLCNIGDPATLFTSKADQCNKGCIANLDHLIGYREADPGDNKIVSGANRIANRTVRKNAAYNLSRLV